LSRDATSRAPRRRAYHADAVLSMPFRRRYADDCSRSEYCRVLPMRLPDIDVVADDH